MNNKHQDFLNKLINGLNHKMINFTNENGDGRVNSIKDESEVIHLIKDWYKDNQYCNYFIDDEPKKRNWYDLAFINKNNQNDIIPINIKVTSMSHADNISSKAGVAFALTGKIPANTNSWGAFVEFLWRNINTNLDPSIDYYFIICNKTRQGDNYWTSLKCLSELTPNGNNLPFQSNWGNNRERINRTQIEAIDFILQTLKASMVARASVANLVVDKCNEIIEENCKGIYESILNKTK